MCQSCSPRSHRQLANSWSWALNMACLPTSREANRRYCSACEVATHANTKLSSSARMQRWRSQSLQNTKPMTCPSPTSIYIWEGFYIMGQISAPKSNADWRWHMLRSTNTGRCCIITNRYRYPSDVSSSRSSSWPKCSTVLKAGWSQMTALSKCFMQPFSNCIAGFWNCPAISTGAQRRSLQKLVFLLQIRCYGDRDCGTLEPYFVVELRKIGASFQKTLIGAHTWKRTLNGCGGSSREAPTFQILRLTLPIGPASFDAIRSFGSAWWDEPLHMKSCSSREYGKCGNSTFMLLNDYKQSLGPFEVMKHAAEEKQSPTWFGCLHCRIRCATKAGEAAHMFRVHGHTADVRKFISEPTCPACLRVFHTMQKTQAHLYYSARCRSILQSRPPTAEMAPGAGSTTDRKLQDQHDRLLPPVQAAGPHNQAPRLREDPKIHHDLFIFLTDLVVPSMCLVNFEHIARTFATDTAISWTLWTSTLWFFEEAFNIEDGQFAGIAVEDLKKTLESLRDPETFPFMEAQLSKYHTPETLAELEQSCLEAPRPSEESPCSSPASFGRHRVLLHAYSGRRRPGDLQYFLEHFHQAQGLDNYVLHIVSMDIVIDAQYGDARNEATRNYWLTAIRDRKVVAFIAGPPCETWTAAREHQLQDGRRGPRPVRSAEELWGLFCMQLRELCQVCIGNELLIFALQAFIELMATGGCGLLEHPAPPPKQTSPSIWKLPIVQALQRHPNVETCRFAQGLLGAPSPKPTQLLLLNLPNMILALHQWRVCSELPKSSAIGVDSSGAWRTAPLKEYPPAMCAAIAEVLSNVISSFPQCQAQEPLPSELQLWNHLCATHYGTHIGADFVAKRWGTGNWTLQ